MNVFIEIYHKFTHRNRGTPKAAELKVTRNKITLGEK